MPPVDHSRVRRWAEAIRGAQSRFPPLVAAPKDQSTSRAQVVAAAAQRLLDEPFSVLSQGLNPSRFDSWMPGLRRKSYRYFPSTVELVREVLNEAVTPGRSDATDELVSGMAAIAGDPPCAVEMASTIPQAYVNRVVEDNVFPLQMYAWLASRQDDDLAARLRSLLDSLNDRAVVGVQPLFQAWGLEPRPPLDWDSFTSIWITVVEGTALRAAIEGDDYDPDLVSWVTMALVLGMTRLAGEDHRDLPTALDDHCTQFAPA